MAIFNSYVSLPEGTCILWSFDTSIPEFAYVKIKKTGNQEAQSNLGLYDPAFL
jgi:hypothetical protein